MNPAQQRLSNYLWLGLFFSLAGGIAAALAWPGTEPGILGGVEETGNRGIAIAGIIVGWLGNMVLLVAIIGYGVKFGREASPATD